MLDVIIVGGGTAGLSAAIYLQRNALQCSVLESTEFGGRIFPASAVENYPAMPGVTGADYSEKLRSQAKALGAELKLQTVLAIEPNGDLWRVTTQNEVLTAEAIIYAAGEKQRLLDVPGEAEFLGRGVASCAACDGAFFRNKDVAVVGGGDKALDDALILSRLCTTVHLIHRRKEFRAAGGTVLQAKQMPNIIMHTNRIVTHIDGTRRVESIRLRSGEDKEEEKEERLAVSGVFVAIGSIPQTALCAGLVSLDEQGYIEAGEDCVTASPGLFVAGDVRSKPFRQLVTAAADGAVAAKAATDYIMRKNRKT